MGWVIIVGIILLFIWLYIKDSKKKELKKKNMK